jgi:hypothetical protein
MIWKWVGAILCWFIAFIFLTLGVVVITSEKRKQENTYIIRNGEMIVLVDDALRQKHVIARLRTISYESYAKRRAQWNKRLTEGVQRRRFNRDPQTLLQQLEDQWDQVDVR